MAYENGDWVMHGTTWDDPNRIKTVDELIEYVDRVGFLPLFKNEIEGFSVEEHASADYWWTGNVEIMSLTCLKRFFGSLIRF